MKRLLAVAAAIAGGMALWLWRRQPRYEIPFPVQSRECDDPGCGCHDLLEDPYLHELQAGGFVEVQGDAGIATIPLA